MNYAFLKPSDSRFERLFLKLPKMLYCKNTLTQNPATEREILRGEHTLSGEFEIKPFLLIDENGNPAARCVLTYYPNSYGAFLGFFECIDDFKACEMLLDAAFKQAKEDGKEKVTGPVDCSYWIRYRFKTDAFEDAPYTMEPYNKEYYPLYWVKCGFNPAQGYYSNRLRVPTAEDNIPKCQKRYETLGRRGYVIEYPTAENFRKKLREVFTLLSKLYSTFPCHTDISWWQFYEMYCDIERILNFDMAKLVYKEGRLVGFSISVPNFGNAACGRLTLPKLLKILKAKQTTREYILIYMGVDEGHLGVGSMIAEAVKRSLEEKRCSAINALIMDDKVTGESYYNSLLTTAKYHYAIYEREL